MRRIILITGGARSGKSTYAEKLALSLSPTPVYLATARIWDEEFRKRVIHHQERRGPEWTNIEEDKELSRHSLSGRTVLIDCITLWCTNFFFDQMCIRDSGNSYNLFFYPFQSRQLPACHKSHKCRQGSRQPKSY